METNYFENYKVHNKTMWKFLELKNKDGKVKMDEAFEPHDNAEILRWVKIKIIKNAVEGHIIKFVETTRIGESRVIIQDWYDTTKKDGYVVVVDVVEKSDLHAMYNAYMKCILRVDVQQ